MPINLRIFTIAALLIIGSYLITESPFPNGKLNVVAAAQASGLTVSVDPPTGKPGDSFHITVSGGTPGEAVTIDYHDDDASTLPSNYNADGQAWFVRQTSIRDTADIEFWIQTVGRPEEMVSGAIVFDPMPGALTGPAAESTLAGSSETFTWTAGVKVQRFHIYVGTSKGGSDIYNATQGSNQTATISGLPTDGSQIYLRLWSSLSTGWAFEDTIFSAAAQARAMPADMRDPASGALLFGSRVTFNWGGGAGVAMYWLYVGTSPGGYDIFNAGQGLITEETVSNLPTDGRTLYVRLWSLLNTGIWEYRDVEYRTAVFIDSGDTLGLGEELPSYVRITGDIASAREEDSFSFFAYEGVDYTFSTQLLSLPDSVLELRSAEGTVVAFNDDFGGGLSSRISWNAPATGTYSIAVRALTESQRGQYALEASTEVEPEHINISPGIGGSESVVVRGVNERIIARIHSDDVSTEIERAELAKGVLKVTKNTAGKHLVKVKIRTLKSKKYPRGIRWVHIWVC